MTSGIKDELNALHHFYQRKGGTRVELGALLSNEGDEFRVDALLIVTIGPR